MEIVLKIVLCVVACAALAQACVSSLEKEARRQCIVALDTCEKYHDAGACAPEFLKVCQNVKI